MPTFRETFVAATPKYFNMVGNYIRIKGRTGVMNDSVSIDLFKNGKKLDVEFGLCDTGDATRVSDGFDAFQVTSSVSQDVTIQVMRGQFESNKVVGDVSVIEGGKARSLAQVAFISAAGIASGAAQFSHAQLWNLPGSGKNLIVNKVVTSFSPVAAGFYIRLARLNATLANLYAFSPPQSKYLGGVASVAATNRMENNAALLGTQLAAFYCGSSEGPHNVPLIEPIVIPPGQGLVVGGGLVNVSVNAQFDHWEENV